MTDTPPDFAQLIADLTSPDVETRRRALNAIDEFANCGDARLVPLLMPLLASDDVVVRGPIVWYLVQQGQPFVDALRETTPDVRLSIVSDLIKVFDTSRRELWDIAAYALCVISDPAVVEAILECYRGEACIGYDAAGRVLAYYWHGQAAPQVEAMLQEDSERVQSLALFVLQAIPEAWATERLLALHQQAREFRLWSPMRALERHQVETLLEIGYRVPAYRVGALEALRGIIARAEKAIERIEQQTKRDQQETDHD